ncbi:MAG: heavy metal-responsive transcriptional regulator [Planctomycetota bacterium]
MSTSYSIGELAAAANLPASTIRHYEREGLLLPAGRSESNYRLYGQNSLERLRFIRAAQASGLVLDDVKVLLSIRDGGAAPCRDVQAVLSRRLEEIEQRLQDLRRVRGALRSAVAACRGAGEEAGKCEVIARLDRESSAPPAVSTRHTRRGGSKKN